jgi:hypothetical protein
MRPNVQQPGSGEMEDSYGDFKALHIVFIFQKKKKKNKSFKNKKRILNKKNNQEIFINQKNEKFTTSTKLFF